MKPIPRANRTMHRSRFRVALVVAAGLGLVLGAVGGGMAFTAYRHYSSLVERKLSGAVFSETALVYAAPRILAPGTRITARDVVERLNRAGYEPATAVVADDRADSRRDNVAGGVGFGGTYMRAPAVDGVSSVTVRPPNGRAFRMEFDDSRMLGAREVESGYRMDRVELPGELITTLFDDSRVKRRLLDPDSVPRVLVDAIVSAEDRRFYDHYGIDPVRVLGAAWSNLRGADRQGASTVTMQLAGSVFLDRNDRSWDRKLPEALIAAILERRLTKDEILTLYVNEIYLGHRGSFAIRGFGEAAVAYFDKDVEDLTVSETATLVGMLPAPNAYAPSADLSRALERRDLVLAAMREEGRLDSETFEAALSEPLAVAPVEARTGLAPYMVDYVREQLGDDFDEQALLEGGLRIHTTIDADLQRAAARAVETGIRNVEEQLAARNRGPESGELRVQGALIVLDPHTGAIRAMVGGRDYGESQYNRITEAFRQPGSIFKPFVYAAAMETGFNPLPPALPRSGFSDAAIRETALLEGDRSGERVFPNTGPAGPVGPESGRDGSASGRYEAGSLATDRMITSSTTVADEPTEFSYDEEKVYTPNNYGSVFHGVVTVREALRRSLNVPAVKIAERVGFDRVADMAHRAGLNADIQAFPSIALGAFEVTPIEIAAAWTVFANEGVRVSPRGVETVEDRDGNVIATYGLQSKAVVRPEIAAVMTHLLENVVNAGTGAGVRARGFTLPAAGKTGTSRDGWFAGYTKDLLAIAWVGFDDNRELGIDGSRSALPIWTEFMLAAERAGRFGSSARAGFTIPPGVELVEIDPLSGGRAAPECPDSETHAFIVGTAPREFCPQHGTPGFSLPGALRGVGRSLSGIFR